MMKIILVMKDYPFDEYICGVTGLTCCGCSLYCEHRKGKQNENANKTNKEN